MARSLVTNVLKFKPGERFASLPPIGPAAVVLLPVIHVERHPAAELPCDCEPAEEVVLERDES